MGFDEEIETITQAAIRKPIDHRRVSLLIYHHDGVRVVPLTRGGELVVGRAAPAEILIRDPSLSRQHARFYLMDGQLWVEDLGSTNGTLVNGNPVTSSIVGAGDEVTLGSVAISQHVLGPTDRLHHGFYNHDEFLACIEEEILRAQSSGRKLALLLVRSAQRGEGHVGHWCASLRKVLRPFDRLSFYGGHAVTIALPDVTREAALGTASAILALGRKQPTPLLAGLALYPDTALSAEALIEGCRTCAQRATLDEPLQVAPDLSKPRSPEVQASAGPDATPLVCSPRTIEVYQTARRIAEASIPVLIYGETGTGKEVLAAEIHRCSGRDGPMRFINCGAIPTQLIESVLFGHERGAFTGAVARSKGVFEEADRGTVMLDEIGELSPPAQTALLRVLETKRISRIGAAREIELDVRIIAATHRDLEAMCSDGTFRTDLFYRLNMMTLRLPPLRDRPEEVAPLAQHFVQLANAANARQVRGIHPQALLLLARYSWPGNVRELRNVIERSVVIARGDTITLEDLPESLRSLADAQPRYNRGATIEMSVPAEAAHRATSSTARLPSPPAEAPQEKVDFKTQVRRFEAALIEVAIERADGSMTDAAKLLGLPRRTLYHRSRKLRDEQIAPLDAPLPDLGEQDLKGYLRDFEASLINEMLAETEGNKAETARRLGLPIRTLVHKIGIYGTKRD